MTPRRHPIAPGGTLGLVGGGQLGRMTALAARALGYRVYTLDPTPDCPAAAVSDRLFVASFDDPHGAARFAAACDVVTCEREDISPAALRALEEHGSLRPGRHAYELVQDRARQKRWLAEQGFALGEHAVPQSATQLRDALEELGPNPRIKCARGGFDGRGQWRASEIDADRLWAKAGASGLVVERELPLEAELSVLVARSPAGEVAVHPAAHNFHERAALQTSVLPASLPEALLAEARALAVAVAERLDLVGVLAVEMFWTREGSLLVNELAPRPHNSFHSTEWACETSQFEQLVRAVCGLPLGSTRLRTPTAILNLYGDLWLEGRQAVLTRLLTRPGVHLRLYDKAPKPRRKLGHVGVTADTPESALLEARRILHELETATAVEEPRTRIDHQTPRRTMSTHNPTHEQALDRFLRPRKIRGSLRSGDERVEVTVRLPDLRNAVHEVCGDWGPMYTVDVRDGIVFEYTHEPSGLCAVRKAWPKTVPLSSPALAETRARTPLSLELVDPSLGVRVCAYMDHAGECQQVQVVAMGQPDLLARLLEAQVPGAADRARTAEPLRRGA